MKDVSKNICLKSEDHSGFLGNIQMTHIDKTDGKDTGKNGKKLLNGDIQNLCSIWT